MAWFQETSFWRYLDLGIYEDATNGYSRDLKKHLAGSNAEKWRNLRDKNGETPLLVAAKKGYANTAKTLAEGKVPPDAQDKEGRTALNIALEIYDTQKRETMVYALLAAGANPNLARHPSRLPLRVALENGYWDIAEKLLAARADPNAGSPLAAALKRDKSHDIALSLLKAGATLESAGAAPGHMPAAYGRVDILQLLKEKGLDFSGINAYGQTMLHMAARNGHAKAARMLLEEKLDIHAKDNSGYTALHAAAQGGHVDAARALLDKNLDIDATDNEGQTPLHKAAQAGHAGMVSLLLAAGARTGILDRQKMSALAFAQQKNSPPVIHMLATTEKETFAKSTTTLAAPINAIPGDEAEEWVRLGNHKVARIGVYPALGRKLTEIFNFESRALLVISENLSTGAESVTPLAPFDSVGEATLKKALQAFRELGGKADEAAVFARQLDKKTLAGPGG